MKHKGLLVLLTLCLMSGCSTSPHDETARTKLKVAVFNGAYEATYWEECVKRFEAIHQDVDVELMVSTNIGNILLPRIDVKDVPDVVYLASSNASGFTQKLMEEHLIEPLDDIVTPALQTRFLDNVLDSAQVRPYADGKLYLAPLYYNVTGLWYNKRLFEAYGYQVPTTWDEFLALGEQAKADGIYLFTYQGLNPTYLEAMLWPMLAQKIGQDGLEKIFQYEQDAWSQPGVKEVLDVFETIAQQRYMQDDTIILSYFEAQRRFVQGEALFLPCGNWLLQEMQDQIDQEEDFAFMQVPSFDLQQPAYATVMVEQIYVPKDAIEKELGKQFIAFQYETDMIHLNQELGGGYVPIKQDTSISDLPKPYHIFGEGVLPLTSNFNVEYGHDSDQYVFEQLAKVLAREQTSSDMIRVMNHYYENIK